MCCFSVSVANQFSVITIRVDTTYTDPPEARPKSAVDECGRGTLRKASPTFADLRRGVGGRQLEEEVADVHPADRGAAGEIFAF